MFLSAHAAHKCTQNYIFLIFNILSLYYIVCKIKKVCAKQAFCVQKRSVCAKCVQMCADCVHNFWCVCVLYVLGFQYVNILCAVVCICVHCFSRARACACKKA